MPDLTIEYLRYFGAKIILSRKPGVFGEKMYGDIAYELQVPYPGVCQERVVTGFERLEWHENFRGS